MSDLGNPDLVSRHAGRALRITAGAAVLLAAGGCSIGPRHAVPAVPLPAAFAQAASAPGTAGTDTAGLARFWQQFQDPALDRLVELAWSGNLDVRMAQTRLAEARASLLGAEAEAMPSLGVEASVNRSQAPAWQQPGASRSQRTTTVYAPSALMNWELDLFGRVQRSTEAAAATVSAQELGIGSVQVALAGAVAGNYLSLRGLQQRLAVARAALTNQQETLRLTEARFAAGRGTRLDVARARSLVASTAAGIPALELQVTRAIQRLATLTSQDGPAVAAIVAGPQPLPRLPVTDLSQLPVGAPGDLLRRRPDVRVAERQAAAASAEIGVAMAERLPRISLSGLLGLNSNRLGDLTRGGTSNHALGASLSWTAFDFGRTDARVQAADARARRSLLVYEQTVRNALEETENALAGYSRNAEQAAQLLVAARQAEEAADLARRRFAAGSADQLTVLDAERQALSAGDQLVQGDTSTATALVDIYRALGGGWQVASAGVPR